MKEYWEHLKWDSDFFGFSVARITAAADVRLLTVLLEDLKAKRYRLVYWNIPAANGLMSGAADSLGGRVVGAKVTYFADLPAIRAAFCSRACIIMPYERTEPDRDLITLALQSGEFSRFKLDPLFPSKLYDKLYTAWITRYVRKEIGWGVLVAKDGDLTMGMVALGDKNGRGDVGLLAVAPQASGKGVGKALMAAAGASFEAKGYDKVQVVTQRANRRACRLYEVCGYKVEKIDDVVHFWL